MTNTGDQIDIIILFPNGIKVKGIALVSEVNYTKSPLNDNKTETGIEYTIPNMHVKFEGTKVVEEFTKVPASTTFFGLASSSWYVDKPLIEVVE